MRPFLLRIALLVALLAPVGAAATDAPRLEREFAAALDALAAADDPVLAYDGVAVRADGGAFDVSVDGLRLMSGADGAFDFGRVAFRLVPQDGDLYEVGDLRLPATVPYGPLDGAAQAVLEIPSLSVAGSWSRRLQGFLAADVAAGDVRLADLDGARALSLGRLSARVDAEETGSGRWTRMNRLSVDGLRLDTAGARLTVEHLSHRSRTDGWMPLDLLTRDDAGLVANQAIAGLLQAGGFGSDGSSRFELRGLSLHEVGPATGGGVLRLGEADIDLAATGLDGDAATVTLAARHSGLALEPGPLAQVLLPHAATLRAVLTDLPGRDLAPALVAFLAAHAPGSARSAGDSAAALVATARRRLLESGSGLQLSGTTIETDSARLALDGTARADPAAALGLVSGLDGEIVGLDALIDRLAALPPDSGAAQAWLMLQTLRAFGAPEPGADGETLYRYAISLGPDGVLLVNGRDLGLLRPGAGLRD